MAPYPAHLILGAAALAATLGIMSLTVNRLVKRKLRLSAVLLAGYLAVNLFLWIRPDIGASAQLREFANLALAAALINLVVFSAINPHRVDHVPDHFPTILQDAIVIGLVLVVATFLSEPLLTTSAVSAVVLGFALQDTLGNAFAGLAIQSEKPFHVGHWIKVAAFEGRVAEVTWRATKLLTKEGTFVVLPNNLVSKEAIINFSLPALYTRIEVDVGATYLVAPNQVKAAVLEAMRHCSCVLPAPEPDVHLNSFDASAITYKARFWIENYAHDVEARDEVRTAIYYAFRRHDIEIPWPIQVQYERQESSPDPAARAAEQERLLANVDLLAALAPDVRRELAGGTSTTTYGSGETIVRQGEPGQSMFVVCNGRVSVVVEPGRHEVAAIDAGGYFGEMSMLTGDPRTATVIAVGDVVVVEIGAEQFRRLAVAHPQAVEQMAVAAATRRVELDRVKTAAAGAITVETSTLLARMRRFLRLA